VPIFAVGTERDHVAPWRSVFKLQLQTDTDVTFLLASGGHNAGIVSDPGHTGRHYHVLQRREGEAYRDPRCLACAGATPERILVARMDGLARLACG